MLAPNAAASDLNQASAHPVPPLGHLPPSTVSLLRLGDPDAPCGSNLFQASSYGSTKLLLPTPRGRRLLPAVGRGLGPSITSCSESTTLIMRTSPPPLLRGCTAAVVASTTQQRQVARWPRCPICDPCGLARRESRFCGGGITGGCADERVAACPACPNQQYTQDHPDNAVCGRRIEGTAIGPRRPQPPTQPPPDGAVSMTIFRIPAQLPGRDRIVT